MDPEEISFAMFFLLLMVVAGVIGYFSWQRSEELRATGKRVRGVIVRNNFHMGRNSVFRPVVRFTTQAGVVVEKEYDRGVAMIIPRFAQGATVWVAYDEHNPYDFLVLTSGRYD